MAKQLSPLALERSYRTVEIIAEAMRNGEPAITYSDLSVRLGMSKVNGQGLAQYLAEAASICARHGLPNVGVMVVSRESLEAGAPMPSDGSFSRAFYEATGLSRAEVPAEQDRVRTFDWTSMPALERPEIEE